MTEMAAIEAVRAAGGASWMQQAAAMQQVPDPDAVAAFSDAMSAAAPDRVPFIDQLAETWRGAQIGTQKNIRASADILATGGGRGLSVGEISRVQYEMNMASLQLEITTLVAKKVSDAVSALVKNG